MKIDLEFYTDSGSGLVRDPNGLIFRGLIPCEAGNDSKIIARVWARIAFCYGSNWATGNFKFYWGKGKSNIDNYGGEYGKVNDYVEIPSGARWVAVEGNRADSLVLVSAELLPLAH